MRHTQQLRKIFLASMLACAVAASALTWPVQSFAGHLVNVGTREAPLGLWVEEQGKGEPILMLHGFGATSYTWRHLAPALAGTHRVISVDLKGAGGSDKPLDDAYGLREQVRLIKTLIDRKGLSGLTLIGHSLGGGVALALALELNREHPGLLKRMVLIDSIAYRQQLPLFIEVLQTPVLAQIGAYGTLPEVLVYQGLRGVYHDPAKISSDTVRAYALPLYEPAGRYALIKIAEQIVPPNLSALVAQYRTIQQPTLLIWGAKDGIVPLWVGRRLARDLPHARLAVVKECGHAPQEECPGRTINLVRAFLR